MRVAAAAAALLLLAGCGRAGERSTAPAEDAGARLEAAAVEAGLIADPATRSITGSWARDTDRLCVVPGEGEASRLGALIDYGGGTGCAASGSVRRRGGGLAVDLGGGCRFAAGFDGERIAFPAVLPGACDRLCTGRATLAALRVERLSGSPSEAESLRTPSGRQLCTG